MSVANIIVNVKTRALDQLYSYQIPTGFQDDVYRGRRVVVPFGRSQFVDGVVWSLSERAPGVTLKAIAEVLSADYALTSSQLYLMKLLRSQYAATYQEAFATVLPSVQKLDKIIVYSVDKRNERWPLGSELSPELLAEQVGQSERATLLKSGVLSKSTHFEFTHRTRQIDWVVANFDDVDLALKSVAKRAVKKQRILKHMYYVRQLTLAELKRATNATRRDIENLAREGFLSIQTQADTALRFDYVNQHRVVAPPPLTEQQRRAVTGFWQLGAPRQALLQGVTGSGKTRVYIALAKAAIEAGQQVLILVPEIALTPQLVERFASQLTHNIGVIHSQIASLDKVTVYNRIKNQTLDVVIGARSALFAPFKQLGLIVIDEEHEHTYKSETIPRYHSVELALALSKALPCDIVLGSATPSIQTHHLVDIGHLSALHLTTPIGVHGLSDMHVIDMTGTSSQTVLSDVLFDAIDDCLTRSEQFILFHNRRGWSRARQCRSCGYVHMCENCAIPMKVYERQAIFNCHYCGFKQPLIDHCPRCNAPLDDVGIGIEQVLVELENRFPDKVFLSVDSDSTKKHKRYVEQLNAFKRGEIDGLIGTQVLAKGLDIANVTLVGVILADQLINFPDYRSLERSYQLLTQVAGRAGRAGKAGQTYIQTFQPEHPIVNYIVKRDYTGFVTEEKKSRDIVGYPPYVSLFTITVHGDHEARVNRQAERIYHFYQKNFQRHRFEATVYPPAQPHYAYVRHQYRAHLVIKAKVDARADVLTMLYYGIINNKYQLIDKSCWVDLDFDG